MLERILVGSMNGNVPRRLCAELDSWVCRMGYEAWRMPSRPQDVSPVLMAVRVVQVVPCYFQS